MPSQTGIAVAADFTAGPIVDSLDFWRRQLGWTDEILVAPYNQIAQSLLDPAGVFATNRTGVNVLLLRRFLPDFREAIASYQASGGAPLLIVCCEAGLELLDLDGGSVHVLPSGEIDRLYPVQQKCDPHAEQLGDVPYTPLYFAALGTAVARTIHALRNRPYKVVALDCDNTLWQGTCGEDGPENVLIDEPRAALQNFMRKQRERGMLLVLASKNNEEDVRETFRAHPEMPLQWKDFIAHRINWESKGSSLSELAAELFLGLDSFVFIDDSSKEIAEAQAARPEVLSLTLPHEPSRIPLFLDHIWAFDQLRLTDEDRQRNENYFLQVERGKVAKTVSTLSDFIEQLQVDVHIQPLQPAQAARVTQLTQRTNQMNTTLVRRNDSEIAQMIGREPVQCFTVDVTDRFGSYGLVGAIFLSYGDHAVRVESFLLSCRALGRGVEHRMLSHVGQIAAARGREFVDIIWKHGPRNQPAQQFLDGLPAAKVTGDVYRLTANVCKAMRYEPIQGVAGVVADATEETPKLVAAAANSRTFAEYGRIARDLNRAQQVLDAIAAEKRGQNAATHQSDPPRNDLERQLAAIWASVLHRGEPGREDDFFDLGGHSLIAVQLLSRVRQEIGVDLSLDLVYSGKLTVASMAAAIELAQADPEEVNRLLAEIESLSEEELQALLESDPE